MVYLESFGLARSNCIRCNRGLTGEIFLLLEKSRTSWVNHFSARGDIV
jgi:hypothetical protein